ncbi:MAG: DUF1080 domain-containing protein [Planctomycetota bacterium]
MSKLPVLALLAVSVFFACAEDAPKPKPVDHPIGYQDTPLLPAEKSGTWHVHDGLRPQPRVVTPGSASTPEVPGKAPADAVVLFDGTNTDKWHSGNKNDIPCKWVIEKGELISVAKAGYVFTKDEFEDFQLHVEWAAPTPPHGDSQGRGNSGVFLHGKYEIQVLDCYNNPTYPDGSAGSVYGQHPPLVNASLPPGQWQTYDIVFTGPKYKEGKLDKPAFVTVIHNGVVTQNHAEILGGTGHKTLGKYDGKTEKGPIGLQDHGNPVRYRNIWIRPLKGYDE